VEWQECWTPTGVEPAARGPLSAASAPCAMSHWNTLSAASESSNSPAATSPTKPASTNTSRSSNHNTAPCAMRHWVSIRAEEAMCWILVRSSTAVRAPKLHADDPRPSFREAK
jgi:hypothetical protein